MPDSRRAWTEDDVAKLETMAGKIPLRQIAAELGRTVAATAVRASKLGISLRTQVAAQGPKQTLMSLP